MKRYLSAHFYITLMYLDGHGHTRPHFRVSLCFRQISLLSVSVVACSIGLHLRVG